MQSSSRALSHAESREAQGAAFRNFEQDVTKIGTGLLGGKAECLAAAASAFHSMSKKSGCASGTVVIPHMHVVATDYFDAFMKLNDLNSERLEGLSDAEISRLFADAALPGRLTAELGVMLETGRMPLIVRSSGLLETVLYHDGRMPYASRFLANSHESTLQRLNELKRAVKAVWASLFFSGTRAFLASKGKSTAEEKTGVIIQDVFGRQRDRFFFPDISGRIISADRRRGYYAERVPTVEASLGLMRDDRSMMSNGDPSFTDEAYAVDLGRAYLDDNVLTQPPCLTSVSDMEGKSMKVGVGATDLGPMDPTMLLEVPAADLIAVGERIVGGPVEIHFAARKIPSRSDAPKIAVLKVTPVVRS